MMVWLWLLIGALCTLYVILSTILFYPAARNVFACNFPAVRLQIFTKPLYEDYHSVISYSLPYGDPEQNGKGKTNGLPRGILKTGLLHKKFCVQSLWEILNYRDKGKNKSCLHSDAKTRMYVPCVITLWPHRTHTVNTYSSLLQSLCGHRSTV